MNNYSFMPFTDFQTKCKILNFYLFKFKFEIAKFQYNSYQGQLLLAEDVLNFAGANIWPKQIWEDF
jgi:hypothetical protein